MHRLGGHDSSAPGALARDARELVEQQPDLIVGHTTPVVAALKTRVSGGRVVQRHVLYLGEINSSQELAWRKSIEVLEDDPDLSDPHRLIAQPEEPIVGRRVPMLIGKIDCVLPAESPSSAARGAIRSVGAKNSPQSSTNWRGEGSDKGNAAA